MIGELVARDWDVIVVGAGLAGGVVGRRLAEKGLSVLFVDRGTTGPRDDVGTLTPDVHDPVERVARGF